MRSPHELSPSQTAVIAAAMGYSLTRWRAFVLPLRAHYSGSVIVTTGPPASQPEGVVALAQAHRVQLVLAEVSCKQSYATLNAAAKCPSMALMRFGQLASLCAPFRFCFSCDFQKD